jgi:hypothetical protein
MEGRSRGVVLAEHVGRILAGALGWILVVIGVLGFLISLVGLFFGPEWRGPIGSLVTASVSVLVVAIGIYGNPKYRERIHYSFG